MNEEERKEVKLTVVLCCLWVLTLLYGEVFAFWVPPLWTCSWPHLHLHHHQHQMIEEAAHVGDSMKVAVITDPQLMDKTSHGLAPKSLILEILQFYTDIFMRRSFLHSVLPFKPDLVLFLGDYFDGGPVLSDQEWQESLHRLKHIFNLDQEGKSSDIPVYYLSGNHDIGYESTHSHSPEVIRRYETEFGAVNHRFSAGGIEFIAVDSQCLDGSNNGNLTSASWDFVRNITLDVMSTPRVLLTHIPLYRPDWTPCGPQRFSPVINQGISRSRDDHQITYQNYLSKETSSSLLDLIKPVLVLSGHDHDQCTVTHQTRRGPVIEHTVGTFSMQQGNLYPSFMLLSASKLALSNTTGPENAVSTKLCFLPVKIYIYIWYLSLFVFTILLLFLPPIGMGCWHHCNPLMRSTRRAISSLIQRDGVKEKDENGPCDYEMIWDAEGSMHLIKKMVKDADLTGSNASRLVGRAKALAQPIAMVHLSPDIESSFSEEPNTDGWMDDNGKLLPKSYKFKMSKVISLLVKRLRILVTIAAVNIPLYLLLLFKDWN